MTGQIDNNKLYRTIIQNIRNFKLVQKKENMKETWMWYQYYN